MADDDRRLEWAATVATKDGNRENQTCNRGDIKATREGEETPELDLGDRGDNKATREGEETSKLDRGDKEATREGEETPELDLGVRGDIKANRCTKPVITKEDKSPGKEGDTRGDEGSRNTYQTGVPQDWLAKLLSNLSWDNEDGSVEEDDAKFLELIGDQAKDQGPQDWLEKLLSNLGW